MDANLDKTNFAATLLLILFVSIPLALNPELGAEIMENSYQFIATNFGWLYLLAGVAAVLLLAWLAFGRYGSVVLGVPGDKPEFSTYSWVAMLFCAGIGAGLMYWSAIEWAYYYQSPPFGVEAESLEAAKWASSYGVFTGVLLPGHSTACPRSQSPTRSTRSAFRFSSTAWPVTTG